MRSLFLSVAISLLYAAPSAAGAASLRGAVTIQLAGTSLATLGPVVVYLDPVDPREDSPAPAPATVRITQNNATFSPSFQVVSVGQTVDMPNSDLIYHNVFSYSRPNDFDLGIYPAGESRSVVFEYPGVVKTYCSIHENMNATIVVVPSRHFDVASRSGRFSIEGVPPGRYRLRTWCEKLPDTMREITIAPGESATLTLDLTP